MRLGRNVGGNHHTLVAGMVLHGAWDLSAFLLGTHANDTLKLIGPMIGYVAYAACVVALILILRRDRDTAVIPSSAS